MTGLPIVLDPDVRLLDGGRVLLGGDPGRLLRLRPGTDPADLVDRCLAGPLRRLADTLVAGGLAHPRPAVRPVADVAVVVPVRDRADQLDRCLAALCGVPVVVVDDASRDPAAVARVARRHGARLVRQDVNTGPAGARNTGIGCTTESLVALVDSDCVVPAGWLDALVGHFDDPAVGAVAPRVLAQERGRSVLARYSAARGPLDLGPADARVHPGGRVPYVPTAALVVRRVALGGGPPFDPALRFGEDVDLVWRMHDAGWTVRYDPRTVVRHAEPDRWRGWLRRRHDYGTSAGPLAQRHGSARLTPLVLSPWPTACWVLLCARQPVPALVASAVPAVRLHRLLRATGLDRRASAATAAAVTGRAVLATGRGFGGAGLVVAGPLVLAVLLGPRARAVAALMLVAPPLLERRTRRPDLDPVRWTALRLVDDLAYASGVWRAAWAARSTAALRPRRRGPS